MEQNELLIPADVICLQHQVELSFLNELRSSGLIEITFIGEQPYLHPDQLRMLEKFIRLHYELEINLQGLEAISHLLQQVEELQEENHRLRKRLQWYEALAVALHTEEESE